MTNKITCHLDTATSGVEGNFEGLKLTLDNTKLKMDIMDSSTTRIGEDNRGLCQDFRALMNFLKKDEQTQGKHLELQEGSSSINGPKSTTGNILNISSSIPAKFGTPNADIVLETVTYFMFTPTSSNVHINTVTLPSNIMVPNYAPHIPFQPFRPHITQPSHISVYSNQQIPFLENMNQIVPSQ